MNSILDEYTDKELIEILEQECEALGISCENNGLETKFEDIVLQADSIDAFNSMDIRVEYKKHMHNMIHSYQNLNLDVALYYAIAAMDFLSHFGVSTWCDIDKVKDMTFNSYRDLHRDLSDNVERAKIVLDTVMKALDTASFGRYITETQLSLDKVNCLAAKAIKSEGILNLNTLQVESKEFILKSHALASACIFDRYATIIPAGFEKDWELVLATYIPLNYTGILIQKVANARPFYHMTSRESAEIILKQGIRPSRDPYTSFGAGVIYTYDDIQKFGSSDPNKFTVLEIRYSGPYLKCMWRQDTDDRFIGECLLYPGYISEIHEVSMLKTDIFGDL